jgi:hypothetical protein
VPPPVVPNSSQACQSPSLLLLLLLLLLLISLATAGTANEVYDEMGPQEGEQYRHISVVQPLACPDLKCLKTINSISSELLAG